MDASDLHGLHEVSTSRLDGSRADTRDPLPCTCVGWRCCDPRDQEVMAMAVGEIQVDVLRYRPDMSYVPAQR